MGERLFSKMRSQSGETLAETLVSMLIAALSILMLSCAVASGSRIIMYTRNLVKEYRTEANELVRGVAAEKTESKDGQVSVREVGLFDTPTSYVVSNVGFQVTVVDEDSSSRLNPGTTYKAP